MCGTESVRCHRAVLSVGSQVFERMLSSGMREAVEQRHHILLRDCRSFEGLGACWLRIGLQSRRNNRRIIRALKQELDRAPLV